jgi:hypothetical protein
MGMLTDLLTEPIEFTLPYLTTWPERVLARKGVDMAAIVGEKLRRFS